jgi:hypothetical protein
VTWSRDHYLAEVLEPARRAGNVPPADLYARYGLPADIRDRAAFDRQVASVVAFWRELRSRQMYARLADTLLTAHADLERAGQLTLNSFAARHADARRTLLERLARLAEGEAGAATHVGPAAVTRLRDALGGAVSEPDVREALRHAGVTVVDAYPELPVPHPKQADLARYVDQLSVRLSVAVVFGDAVSRGFRILGGFCLADGQTLGEAEFAAAQNRIAALPYSDPAKTPSENVLAILRAAARTPGGLDKLLLSEIVARLQPLARSGFVQRVIAAQATRELGLQQDEAGRIAAAMLTPDSLDAVRQQVAGELAHGRLREAQRRAAGLPQEDPLRERIAAADAEVAATIRRAEAEQALGHLERAAALLAEAIGLAGDDAALSERLAAIPPPPPREAAARMDGDRVRITWKPSPATAGPVRYLVIRGRDQPADSPAQGVAVITGTERTDVTDADAPPGAELHYSVFAARGGEAWSPPATAPPVTFAPDVADVSVTAGDASVGASWRPHPGADAVSVVRREDRPPSGPDDGTAVEASLTGFADSGLRNGTGYYYLIAVSYLSAGGQRRRSAGVVVKAVPEPAPRPVDDLEITGPGDGTRVFLAIWTPPPYGRVLLVRSDEPLPWPAGTRIRPAEAAALPQLPGAPHRGTDGRDVLELRLPSGRHQVTALTAGHNAVVVGRGTEVWQVEPVRGLSADRMHDDVRLGWIWPDHATDALVRWPGGEHRCSRRVYHDEGGVVLTVGAAETTIEVHAIYPRRGGQVVSAGASCLVPGRGVAISYRIRSAGWWRRRQRAVELVTERATSLPALVVVRTTGPYPPDDPSEGTTIERVDPRDVTPGQPATFRVAVGRGPAWVACFVDPEAIEEQADGILLFPPPAEEMRIR